jgi:hypothetical protein
MAYKVTVIRELAHLHQILPEWQRFVAAGPRGCSLSDDPALIEYALSKDGLSPYIVVVRKAGRIECIAPFCVQSSRFSLRLSVFKLASFPVRLLKLFGENIIWSADADMAECCPLIFGALDFESFDLAYFEALDSRTPLWEYCSAANGKPNGLSFVRPTGVMEKSFRIDLPPTFAEYVAKMGSKTRYSRKRSTRILFAEHGAELTRISTAEQVRSFLSAVDNIYRDSWQSKTYGHWQRDSEVEIARFVEIARLGWLRSYLLTCKEGPLAFLIGYLYRDVYYIPAWAFAQRWSNLGAGAVLVYLTIEDLYKDTPPKTIDLGYGESAIKRSFRGEPYDVCDYYVSASSRWRALVTAQRRLSGVELAVRATLVRSGFDGAVRRVLKHKRKTQIPAAG